MANLNLSSARLARRRFLRGLGTAVALPLFESMMPLRALRADPASPTAAIPRRMAFVYVPNGANMADWTPAATGSEFALPPILQPLESIRSDLMVLTGLAQDKGWPHGDGAGDHARASATFLTASKARKTGGADIKVGVSVDQVAAQRIGHYTRLPSLELGTDRARLAGECDSGYSCAYSFNISWRTESSPMPPEVDPRLVFDRLFGNGHTGEEAEARRKRDRYRKSILDFALDDARQLKSGLGYSDRRKLDEYLTAVRELEQRIERSDEFAANRPDYDRPTAMPRRYEDHLRLMFDLLVLAFQTDTTRISSFIMAHDGSNRQYPFIGVREGHHDLSHHGGNEEKKSKIAKINRFHVTQFGYFLNKLKSIQEGDGSLLDHCMIVYGSGLGDGNNHNHDNLPVLLAGGKSADLRPGRHVEFPKGTPMANLYRSLLDRMGSTVDSFGDSNGVLTQI